MSDLQLFFIYAISFAVIGAFVRYAMGASIATLQPYRDGALRTYSKRAKRAVWFMRGGYTAAAFFLYLTYKHMGVFCCVMFCVGYFLTYLVSESVECDISNNEILEAASISQASQIK